MRRQDLADDIAQERAQRIQMLIDEKAARQSGDKAQQQILDRLTANIRWVAAAIILPIALFVAAILLGRPGAAL